MTVQREETKEAKQRQHGAKETKTTKIRAKSGQIIKIKNINNIQLYLYLCFFVLLPATSASTAFPAPS